MSADAVDAEEQPLTVKEAVNMLASLQASQVLPVLRHSDFMMVAGLAFAGFRQDAGSYSNPIVRRRLAEEAAKNPSFAKKLREITKQPKPTQSLAAAAHTKSEPELPHGIRLGGVERETEKYRAERDRLKQERDAAVSARQSAERLLTEAKRDLIAVLASKLEGERETERIKQRLERVERKQRQLEATNAALRRAAVQPGPGQSPLPAPLQSQPPTAAAPDRHFAEAVRHLIGKQKEALAISIASDVLRSDPDDVDALEIKADALIRINKEREATPILRTLVSLLLKRDFFVRAAGALTKLLRIATPPTQESKSIRDFMAALPRCTDRLDRVADPLNVLRTENPAAFDAVKSLTPGAWFPQLFPEQMTFSPDAALPLLLPSQAGFNLTVKKLISAVEQNDWTIVELVQDALRQKESEEQTKILDSLALAVDGDNVYSQVLLPKHKRGPVVVDCSNVAWHGQEHVAQKQPRLNYVLAIRRALWLRGYFPVLLIADANFPYVVNDPAMARKMVDEEQIQLVMGGSDADEQIIREAQRLNAPIVTNDYMVDWDPQQRVAKLQYTFSPDGKPTVYF